MTDRPTPADATLEPWRPKHSRELLRLVLADREDIEHREPWRAPEFFTLAGQQRRAEQITAREVAGECLHYVVRASGMLVGTAGLELLDREEGELGYWIAQPFRRRGLATAAAALVLERASDRGIRRVRANVHADNLASVAVLRHVGFPDVAEQVALDDGTGVERAHLRFWLDVEVRCAGTRARRGRGGGRRR